MGRESRNACGAHLLSRGVTMNFTHLFTTARVVRALYQTVSTTILLYYIAKRMKNGQKPRIRQLGRYED